MKTFDWIVIGAGITGSALSYELAKAGFSVLLTERDAVLQGATRFGYGGLAFWSGSNDLTRKICAEGIELHHTLSQELGGDTEFRILDLILTIAPTEDPHQAEKSYADLGIPPRLLSVEAACELEPLLNPAAIGGALTVKHGHIAPEKTARAYNQAFTRLGGTIQIAQVTELVKQGKSVTGVVCGPEIYSGANIAVCAGGLSRALLRAAEIQVPLYFTHAELIETPALATGLRTLVMPADTKRFQLEANASTAEQDKFWNQPGYEPVPSILDAGAIQFKDGSYRIGQVSRVLTDPNAAIDAAKSEAEMRSQVGEILPALKELPGKWHHCLIAFSRDSLPLVGAIPGTEGVHLFSGFSNPLVVVPPLARRFAQAATGRTDQELAQLSPARFL